MTVMVSNLAERILILSSIFGVTVLAIAQTPNLQTVMPAGSPDKMASAKGPEITGYSFNPLAIKRDPFMPPQTEGDKKVSDIQLFDVNEMNLVAVLTGMGKPQAMIVLPNGKTEIVSEGALIGRRNGTVSRITPNEVQVKESFRDYQNRLKTDITSLVIAD